MSIFKVQLPYSNKTIYNSIAKDQNFLKLLDIIDLFFDHKILSITNSKMSGKNIFHIELSKTLNKAEVTKIFQNAPHQVFLCSEIRLFLQEGIYVNKLIETEFIYESQKNHINFDLLRNKSDKYGISFIGFKQKTFFKNFNKEDIVKYIYNQKSFNWYFNKNSVNKITLNHLTNLININRKKLIYENFEFKKTFKFKGIAVNVNFDFKNNHVYQNILFHNSYVQLFNSSFEINDIFKKIDYLEDYKLEIKNINKYISYHLEFMIDKCEFNENFHINLTDKFKKDFEEIISTIAKNLNVSSSFTEIISKTSLFLKAQQTEKLNIRREKIKRSKKVFYNKELIYKHPDNEQEVVMIFMILTSRKFTPFHHFELLDYSTAEGIDAWADVQLFEDEMRSDKLIEFETTYKKFLKHGHSAKQVNIVVCWNIENEYKSKFRKHNNWLYRNENLNILVIEISSLPGVNSRYEQ